MSKIVCDICGTTYSEVEMQCPICGSARPADAQIVEETTTTSTYTYVKGGRYSKANVRKRNSGAATVKSAPAKSTPAKSEPKKAYTGKNVAPAKKAHAPKSKKKDTSSESNRGLVITAIVLLIAVIAVVGYIAVRYFFAPTTQSAPDVKESIPCAHLTVEPNSVSLSDGAESVQLKVTRTPSNTTDQIKYESLDENIATVDENGNVTAHNPGTTQIKITCGEQEQMVTVNSTVNQITLVISPKTLKLTFKNELAMLRIEGVEDVELSDIEWSSEDETVATVKDGIVTAVGEGSTKIYGTYRDDNQESTASCLVTVAFAEEEEEEDEETNVTEDGGDTNITEDGGNTGVTEDGGNGTNTGATGELSVYVLGNKTSDFTIQSGESFTIVVKDSNGNTVDAVLTLSDATMFNLEGNVISFVSGPADYTTLTVSYNGMTTTCTVRRG